MLAPVEFVENQVVEAGPGVWMRVAIDNISWADMGNAAAVIDATKFAACVQKVVNPKSTLPTTILKTGDFRPDSTPPYCRIACRNRLHESATALTKSVPPE